MPAAILAAAGTIVFRGALDLYFAQDDFRGLAVAAGVHPRHTDLWRHVSVRTFMDVLHPLFGMNPRPYHLASLAIHAANVGVLYSLLARALSPPAAFIGTAFFATHPAHFTALYWLSARSDLMAAFFALIAVVLSLRSTVARWMALPLYVLSVLSKESTLMLPIAILAIRVWWSPVKTPSGWRGIRVLLDAPTLATLGAGLAYAIYLAQPRSVGIEIGLARESAYALDFGQSLVRNLLTYTGWTVDLAMATPGLRFVDTQNPALYALAGGTLLAAVAGCATPALGRRGWMVGLAGFLLMLLPVLPLRNHTYRYYLYVALIPAATCVAVLADTLLARARGVVPARAVWVVAALLASGLTWNGSRLVDQMATRPSAVYPGMFGDPIVDRAKIAERVIRQLDAEPLPSGAQLGFVMRERLALLARIRRGSGEEPPPAELLYPELNVKAAILDGLAVRALLPRVDSVSFAPPGDFPGPSYRFVVYAPDGSVEAFTPARLDSLLMSDWVTRY